ncbi:hypothetical protein GOP47_0026347 [Adiantum capillus-veneris]|nr:hypothetical protein GOP47_0026347 [Adiantum capillus-veneris]
MVWILTPHHPSLGVSKYYLTSAGTYKIGRKDCAIIIQTDKTVSRLHAEIRVDPVNNGNGPSVVKTGCKPRIVLRDLSKFGSFVNRSASSKPVFSLPNKEKELHEGDIVTFGTDSSSFRLEYFSFRPYIAALADESRRQDIASLVASAGGYIVDNWCSECTHLIVEDGSNVHGTVIQAVADKRPVIGLGWIEALSARSSLSSEFVSCSRFTPNLQWKIDGDAKYLKVIEPDTRSVAFQGFVFYIGSIYLYNNKDILQLLVEASGGSVCAITEVSRSRVPRSPQQKSNEILILPALEPKLQRWMSPEEVKSIAHMQRTSEEKFVAAVLTGEFKEEYYEESASPTASASSDETVEASNSASHEEEISSANQADKQAGKGMKSDALQVDSIRPTSTEFAGGKTPQVKATIFQQRDKFRVGPLQASLKGTHGPNLLMEQATVSVEDFKDVQKPSMSASTSYSHAISEGLNVVNAYESSRMTMEELGETTSAIEFRKDLIVRKYLEPLEKDYSSDLSAINFKRFKKKLDSSGNSFAALVPFAKEPYRESDFNKELQEYAAQEKKRKQAEEMAEELFNAEQLKRKKGVGTSLVTALREGRLKINT